MSEASQQKLQNKIIKQLISLPFSPPFAFLEFEDERDASDAVKARNNYDYDG